MKDDAQNSTLARRTASLFTHNFWLKLIALLLALLIYNIMKTPSDGRTHRVFDSVPSVQDALQPTSEK